MKRPGMMSGAVLVALALAAPAAAAELKAGELTFTGMQIRTVPAGVPNTAGYLVIANSGARPDKLLSATCACARKVELHLSHQMSGVAMMMPEAAVEIPARGKVVLAPSGLHLMVVGLKAPLDEGADQPIELKFAHAGTVTVPFQVRTRIEADGR